MNNDLMGMEWSIESIDTQGYVAFACIYHLTIEVSSISSQLSFYPSVHHPSP